MFKLVRKIRLTIRILYSEYFLTLYFVCLDFFQFVFACILAIAAAKPKPGFLPLGGVGVGVGAPLSYAAGVPAYSTVAESPSYGYSYQAPVVRSVVAPVHTTQYVSSVVAPVHSVPLVRSVVAPVHSVPLSYSAPWGGVRSLPYSSYSPYSSW